MKTVAKMMKDKRGFVISKEAQFSTQGGWSGNILVKKQEKLCALA